jgi:hypothetical protein
MSLAGSREERDRGRREIEAEIERRGEGETERRERGREGGKREILPDCPLSFKHFIGFRERGGGEREGGKRERVRERRARRIERVPVPPESPSCRSLDCVPGVR